MDNRFDVIKLKIMRTANGYYVEYEADKVITSYSVTGKVNDWAALNPALVGIFETPFKVPKKMKDPLTKENSPGTDL